MNKLTECIVCNGSLNKVVYLGPLYPSKFVDSPIEIKNHQTVETFINWCDKCKNMQSPYVDDGENLFRDYYYNSGINSQMRAALQDIVDSHHIQDTYMLHDEDNEFSWLEIACNDGTMCQQIKDSYPDTFVVGVDPANVAHKGSDIFVNDFFSADIVRKACEGHAEDKSDVKFNVISCIAMMYDIEKIHQFIEDVKSVLREDGTFVAQLMDLESRLKTYAIDDCCFEHVVCYSLECLDKLFKFHGLEIYDCEYNKTNCSSLRIYVGFPGVHDRRENVDQMIRFQSEGLTKEKMMEWEDTLGRKLVEFKDYLITQKKAGKRLYLIGASTKASTLLQICDINHTLVDYALELSDFKFGKFMMESGIPIKSEREHFNAQRNFENEIYIAAIWAFKDSILKNYSPYIKAGATVVFPLPALEVFGK